MRFKAVVGILALAAMLLSVVPIPAYAVTVSLPVQCTMDNAATPQATVTLTQTGGGSPSPNTVLCDGVSHAVTVNAGEQVTATEPADGGNSRDRFLGGAITTTSPTTCGSGTCPPWAFTNYLELAQTFQMTPLTPTTWDAAYAEPLIGRQGGQSGTLCTFSLANGGGVVSQTCWADFGRAENFTRHWTSSFSGFWNAWSAYSFTDTVGGNTHNVFYALIVTLTASTQGQVSQSTTTVYKTVTAMNNPTLPNIVSVMVPFIVIFAFAGLFVGMAVMVDVEGDIIVTILLFGLFLGSAIGTLFQLVPGAFVIVFAILFFLWLWQGGTAGEPLSQRLGHLGRRD